VFVLSLRWTQRPILHLFGTCSHNSCFELPAPRGALLRRTAKAGGDHQAGQPHAAGGSAAVSYDPQFRKEYLHRIHQKPKAVATVALGHTTVLDAAHAESVSSRRSHREQPAGGPGRRELDRDLRKTESALPKITRLGVDVAEPG
jgi:hypothetical protein